MQLQLFPLRILFPVMIKLVKLSKIPITQDDAIRLNLSLWNCSCKQLVHPRYLKLHHCVLWSLMSLNTRLVDTFVWYKFQGWWQQARAFPWSDTLRRRLVKISDAICRFKPLSSGCDKNCKSIFKTAVLLKCLVIVILVDLVCCRNSCIIVIKRPRFQAQELTSVHAGVL